MGNLVDAISRTFAHKRFNLIAFGVISVMILIAYSNTFTASFHFDDNPSIIENPSIRHLTVDNILNILRGIRPVVYLSIMLNYQLGGLNVVGYHAFNIGVHILTSCFVYLLVLRTLALSAGEQQYRDRARQMALFAALLFGVHPIQTESVTYIISRSELLAACFYLATFLLLIRAVETKKFAYVVGMFVTALLSMSSKEWAVTLPAMLALYDYLFLSEGNIKTVFSRWYVYLLTALPSAVIFNTLDLSSKGGSAGVGFNLVTTTGVTPTTYFLTSLNVLWTYIRLMFLPINQNLDYDYPIAKTLFEFPTLLSLAGHIAVVAACFWMYLKKGWRLVPFGMAWFYITLSPVQSIVPVIDVIFEHRMYLPSLGIILAFIVVYELVFDWFAKRKAPPAAT